MTEAEIMSEFKLKERDIVERLRSDKDTISGIGQPLYSPLCQDAADEIEKLRAELLLAGNSQCAHEFVKTVGYFGEYVCEKCGTMENFINGISGSKYEFVK